MVGGTKDLKLALFQKQRNLNQLQTQLVEVESALKKQSQDKFKVKKGISEEEVA
jgi:hypothetical protein